MRESKEARTERQALELWQFVDLLVRAGNVVSEELAIVPERKWRVDLVINGIFALEIEGYGRHQSWAGWHSDLDKYNSITIRGWRLLRVTREMISNGDALDVLARAGIAVEPKVIELTVL